MRGAFAVGVFSLFVGILVGALTTTKAQPFVNQGCVQMNNGNIIIAPFVAMQPAVSGGEARVSQAPRRITLSNDLAGSTQICRETEGDTTCKTVDELFRVK